MADANSEMTLDALHTAITAAIAAAFPDFKTVEFYRDDEAEFATPACLLEMIEVEPRRDRDAGTQQLPALLRFDARIIMAKRSATVPLEIRKAAAALAAWLYLRRFPGVFTDEVDVIACEPDEFAPHLDRFTVWRVEFVALAFLGETAWKNDGTIPTDVRYSFAPNIGIGHESDYKPATGVEPTL